MNRRCASECVEIVDRNDGTECASIIPPLSDSCLLHTEFHFANLVVTFTEAGSTLRCKNVSIFVPICQVVLRMCIDRSEAEIAADVDRNEGDVLILNSGFVDWLGW